MQKKKKKKEYRKWILIVISISGAIDKSRWLYVVRDFSARFSLVDGFPDFRVNLGSGVDTIR